VDQDGHGQYDHDRTLTNDATNKRNSRFLDVFFLDRHPKEPSGGYRSIGTFKKNPTQEALQVGFSIRGVVDYDPIMAMLGALGHLHAP
jgi:hypothetical protein